MTGDYAVTTTEWVQVTTIVMLVVAIVAAIVGVVKTRRLTRQLIGAHEEIQTSLRRMQESAERFAASMQELNRELTQRLDQERAERLSP
jgi:uncharacterized membrane protein (DUF106 family)